MCACCNPASHVPTICWSQLGLEVKTKPTEELTETVEITEEVDEEVEIQNEASSSLSYAEPCIS